MKSDGDVGREHTGGESVNSGVDDGVKHGVNEDVINQNVNEVIVS